MARIFRLNGLAATLSLALVSHAAVAASCDSAATVAAGVWDQYRNVTETLGCKSPLGGRGEFVACGITRFKNETHEDMVGWWNSAAANRWATIGPRNLGAEVEEGTVVFGTRRTFVSMVPSFNTGKITITQRSGQGDVTLCATDADGKTEKLVDDAPIESGTRTLDITQQNAVGKILSVVINAKSPAFAYSIRKTETPIEWNFGKIEGLADLHLHQASELGFGGLFLHGAHDGPQKEALQACRALNITDTQSIVAAIEGMPVAEKSKLHAKPYNVDKPEKEEVFRHGPGFSEGNDKFSAWPHFSDIAHQQVYVDWLKEAHDNGLKLVVVSAVNNELLCRGLRAGFFPGKNDWPCDDMSNLKRQIQAFNDMDQKYDWYEVALHPWHARKIIHEGKLAVVIAAESSHMFPESEGDFKKQLDELYRMGLRSLQIVHERDNRFSGAAPHRHNFQWHQITSNPLTATKAALEQDKFDDHFTTDFDLDEQGKNRKGLLGPGYELVDAMVQRHMLIDVSHFSAKALDDLHAISKKKYNNYPFFASHTRFEARLDATERDILKEFLTTDAQAAQIKEVGGMLGLRTGPTPTTKDLQFDSHVANDCASSSKSYAQLVSHAKKVGIDIAFGSDFGGVTQQMSPRYGPAQDSCYTAARFQHGIKAPQGPRPAGVPERFNVDGLRHIGYLPDLYADLKALNTTGVDALWNGAEKFIAMWEKAYEATAAVPVTVNTGCGKDSDCQSGEWCDAGADLKANVCRPLRKDNEACPAIGGGHACVSGKCSFGRCYTENSVSAGGGCFVNSQCRTGKCSSANGLDGTCVCDADADCGSGQWCNKGLDLKVNRCERKLARGEVCGTVGEVGVGHRCLSGSCKVSGLSTKLKCQ